MEAVSAPVPQAPSVLPEDLQALYDHVVCVLGRHLDATRRIPLTGDLIEKTQQSFSALDALVAPLKVPPYDLDKPEGRLMAAIVRLNREMPGVALRTLWVLHEYLSTSDDDGVQTRQRALGIIQDLGLPGGDSERSVGAWTTMARVFPPLP